MVKEFLLVCIMVWGISSTMFSQDIEIFKVSDFNLKGNVKSCLVITDYGKEEYYFNTEGFLTKSITRFNDTDYETTYYKYLNGFLKERRVENYMDGSFDYATSIASLYEIDTVARKITEKIVSYEKQQLEKNVYIYDADQKLTKLVRTNTSGIDESDFEYVQNDSVSTITQTVNGMLSKLITTSQITENGQQLKKVVSENYIEGNLASKVVEVFDDNSKLTAHGEFFYDSSTQKWISQKEESYQYDENGFLSSTKTKKRFGDLIQQYIYQFDSTPANNWVKEIITPNNTYTTRRIKYYPSAAANIAVEEKK
ncbi:hypothetical protein D9O36_05260 [Zobellia amurskyensis]|uniref:YD repeat-containing protein n=1 Tax=Zobellia amurskyensis TaxID=248905 RepID=A0A7X3D1A9_9FLAO|nr:hypothetical protein [Zobellia amurskyensis]MUH35241.1 hypothetical protein [Zobellia amurskyensis]